MTCRKCKSTNVKHFESWFIKMTEPTRSMWAYLNPTCLFKWP